MRGKTGIIDASMLVRHNPFAEWVVVYYDPSKTSENQILKTIRSKGCPRATQVRQKSPTTVMNPVVAPGDTVQLRLTIDQETSFTISSLPKGWLPSSPLSALKKGVHYISVRTPSSAKKGKQKIVLQSDDGQKSPFDIELVSLVPQ